MSTFISEPGTRLGGRYRLEDRIATAAGWAAWKAIDEILARPVTVLTFAPGFPRISEVVTAARAASRLNDSRLAQVFDVEDDWDHAYVVMEWTAGDTLDDMLAEGPLEPLRAARLIAEAASAISAAHAAGVAHLCLAPESLRWTAGGGVKVVGLGIDAALSSSTAEDPALADTRGLGSLLYAALTGHWPGLDSQSLPPAPLAEGLPRTPRQVRAGVPAALDEITCQALQLGHGGAALTTPAELSAALKASIPPTPPPAPVPQPPRAGRARAGSGDAAGSWPGGRPDTESAGFGGPARRPPGGQTRSRAVVIAALAVVVLAVVGAAYELRGHHGTPSAGGHHPSASASTGTIPKTVVLTPSSARGFKETSNDASKAIDGNPSTSWQTQWYKGSPVFGNLKKGSGLLLDMGQPVRLSSVTVKFGPLPGADVQIKIGRTAEPRTQATADNMTTVAQKSDVVGTETFPVTNKTMGRYVLIWFTKLPPRQGHSGEFEAEIYNIVVNVVKGTG